MYSYTVHSIFEWDLYSSGTVQLKVHRSSSSRPPKLSVDAVKHTQYCTSIPRYVQYCVITVRAVPGAAQEMMPKRAGDADTDSNSNNTDAPLLLLHNTNINIDANDGVGVANGTGTPSSSLQHP